MILHGLSSVTNVCLLIICDYFYQSGYYSYLIKEGLSGVRMLEMALGYVIYVVQKLGLVFVKLFYKNIVNPSAEVTIKHY